MKITIDTIMERHSVRSYSGQVLSPKQISLLEELLSDAAEGNPFGNRPRFRLTGPGLFPGNDGEEARIPDLQVKDAAGLKIGTYGVIKNPPAFIVGAVSSGPYAVLDYGYALEGVILAATAMGLGTCWLGGTFNRSSVRDLISLQNGEIVPAITPVGLAARSRSFTERAMRFIAGSDSRKPWNQLFLDRVSGKPLDKASEGNWAPVLEALRMGPSASNKQPWRVLRDGPAGYSLFFAEDKAYNNALGLPIQELDLGIAMRHFELAAQACGLPGRWIKDDARQETAIGILNETLAYVASWRAGG